MKPIQEQKQEQRQEQECLLPFEKIKKEVIIKKDAKTNPNYGCQTEKRSVQQLINYGIINLNKPAGPTSHQVSDYVQKILGIEKAGHGGTLDPHVTGVLPIALAKATRIVQALLPAGKEYIALMHLHNQISEQKIHSTLEEFRGKIRQIPPLRSAVKRQERERTIHYLKTLEISENGKEILFKIGCQAGTYIRKFIHDFGQKLGTGAHMTQLVRTKAGPFTDQSWHSLQDLKDAYEFYNEGNEEEIRKVILPFEEAISHLPKIWVFDSAISNLCHGSSLGIPGISKLTSDTKPNDLIAILTLKDELICLANATLSTEEILKKDKGLAATTSKVFMERNTYPKPEKPALGSSDQP